MPSESTLPYSLPDWPFDFPEPEALCANEPEASYHAVHFKDTIPNYRRRDKNHDYTNRCIYMVTIKKTPSMPALSEIYSPDGNYRNARARHSSLGIIINNEIENLPANYPGIKIFDTAIMPDHVHFIIYISVKGKYHLSRIVAALKARCSTAWHDFQGKNKEEDVESIFIDGYHDRYSRNSSHLDTMKRYVRDNPRRILIKRLHPEYFRQRRRISIDGQIYVMIGNPFLILNPFIGQAHYSSRRSPDENRAGYDKCLANIERGGVTIGTFFAHPEKDLRDKAIANGCPIILMHGNGFSDRYAPPQPYFDLCMEGRCLIIGEETYRTSATADIREHNSAMNVVAGRIASGDAILRKPV